MRIKKKPFILLELLIAFALVSGCALPFIRYPQNHLSGELDMLCKMELMREAENTLADVTADLYLNKIDSKIIFSMQEHPTLYEKQDFTLELPQGIKRTFIKKISLQPKFIKTRKTGEKASLLEISVSLDRPKSPFVRLTTQVYCEARK